MRPVWIIIPVIAVAGLAGAVGYRQLTHDPMADARHFMAHGQLRQAQLTLREIVRDHPDRTEAHLRLGEVQLQLGDPIAAEHQIREAADQGADEHAIRPLLALAVVAQGREDHVLAQGAEGLDPEQAAQMHLARAMAAIIAGKPALARDEAASARIAQPSSGDIALRAARIALAANDLPSAERDVGDALTIAPRNGDALALKAELLAHSGDAQAAIAAYGAALAALAPTQPEALAIRLSRARLELRRGDDAGAAADVRIVLRLSPRNPGANMLDASLDARAKQWRAANEALGQVGPVLDDIPRAGLLVATIKANNGEMEQALDAAEAFNRRFPDDRTGALTLASLDLAAHQPGEAIRLLEPWDASGHADVDLLALLSEAFALSGDQARADATLRRAGDAGGHPADIGHLDRLASIALRENDPALAADELSAALDRAPAQPTETSSGLPSRESQTAAGLIVTSLRAGEVDRAAASLDRLRASHADPMMVDLLTGDVKLAQFDIAGARAAFTRAHDRAPDQDGPTIGLARAMRLQGDADGALTLLHDALDKRPTDPVVLGAYVDLALFINTPKSRDDATAAAETAHRKAPTDVGITQGLATLDLRTGRDSDALAVANTLPGDTPTKLGLRADADRALGRIDEAAASWQALLAKSPKDVPLRHRIVGFLVAGDRFDDARRIVADGLAITPDDPDLQSDDVRLAVAKGGLQAGLARADAFAASSTDKRSRLLKGQLLLSARRFDDAAQAFAAARASLSPDAAALREIALYDQAIARIEGGDRQGGTTLLEQGLASDPDAPLLEQALAGIEIGSGDLAAARGRLVSVLRTRPNDVVARNDLAWIEQQQGQLALAKRDAISAYEAGPGPDTADTLGWILLAGGDNADALLLLSQAAGQTHNPAIQYHFAAALKQAGKPADAKAVLTKALAAGTPFSERADAQTLMRTMSP